MRSMMTALRLLSLVATLAVGSDALAQQRPGPAVPPTPTMHSQPVPVGGKVDVELRVVHATNNGKVDAELSELVDNLKFTRFTGFAVLQTHSARVAPGQDASFTIVGGRRVQITLVDRDDKSAKVRVLMFNQSGKVMDTTVSIHRNRAFIIAGPDHEGGKLVLPVTVGY